jgi:Secretory lipase
VSVSSQYLFALDHAKRAFLSSNHLKMRPEHLLAAIFGLLCVTVRASSPSLQLDRVQVRGDSCHVQSNHLSTLSPPSQDSWYLNPPVGFEFTTPGTILRIRKAPGSLSATTANSSAAYNILYRTTDSRYEPTWAVATLFIPALGAPHSGRYLLSYQIPYDNADVDGSPSYQMYTPNWTPTAISTALGRGWHVLTGDYEGPLASFTAGAMSGHAVLDGVQAVLSGGCASTFGLLPSVKYALWGYSGGALASEYATELQQDYAPELDFVGAAMGGLTPNATSVRDTVEGTVIAA